MPRFEQDMIKRQIRQLGDMVAAVVARARADHDYKSGLEAIRKAAAGGLGPDRTLLDRLDAPSAAELLRDEERVLVYAQICAAEAELLEELGRQEEAARLRTRAADLERAGRGRAAG